MLEVLGIISVVLLLIAVLILLYNSTKEIKVIAPEVRDRIVPAINQFNPDAEVTTVCPAPFAAQACSHDWEVVNETILEMPHEKRMIHVMKCLRCGLVDKTMATTSEAPKPPPPPPLPKCECRHRWEKEKVVTLESAYEQMAKVKGSNGQWKKDAKIPELSGTPEPWMFRKVFISVRVCTQCGEIDKSIVSNMEGDDNGLAEGE
jgi:Zn ribbon nucleic-acid-binding protein